MRRERLSWQQELEIIDRTMRAISGVTDPEKLVEVYWDGIGELITVGDYVAISRRNVEPPFYLITRSSRFTEHLNPWLFRDRLPRLSGGLLGEIADAGKPVVIEDLPARLKPDDPAHFYLDGFAKLIATPQYDSGQALNITMMLLKPGDEIDYSLIPTLHWQSGLFGRGTQNLVLRNQLSAALAALQRELEVVGEIQRSLLPARLPSIPGVDVAAFYQTSARAGGDYYDFFPLPHGQWGLFIADVSGHGTPSAVLMAITHAIAHAQPGTHTPPAALLRYLNDQLTRLYTRDGTFITAFYAVLDPAGGTLDFARAGHNPPRLVRAGKVLSVNGTASLPLGIVEGQPQLDSRLQLRPGDLLLLYTDGITEAMAPAAPTPGKPGSHSRELFGTDRLDRLLLDLPAGGSAQEVIDRVRDAVAGFAQAAPSDDQTLIAIRCN